MIGECDDGQAFFDIDPAAKSPQCPDVAKYLHQAFSESVNAREMEGYWLDGGLTGVFVSGSFSVHDSLRAVKFFYPYRSDTSSKTKALNSWEMS